MKKSTKILSLSAAALLVLLIAVILIRRRGRKVKIRQYRLDYNQDVWVYNQDFSDSIFYRGTLYYVILAPGWKNKIVLPSQDDSVTTASLIVTNPDTSSSGLDDFNNYKYVPIVALGVRDAKGSVKTERLKSIHYIASYDLEKLP